MAAYTTVQDLLNDLTAVSNIDNAVSEQTVSDPEGFGWDLQLIKYQRSYPNNTIRIFKNWVLVKSDGTVWWWSGQRNGISGGIPNPLISEPTTRDPYRTESQYITAIENNFADWSVLRISVKVDGDIDRLSVFASNNTDDRVISREIIVWIDSNSNLQWKLKEQV